MIKRLSISLLLMGLAAFSLGAAAFAYFWDSGEGTGTISTANVDLEFRIDQSCDPDNPNFDIGPLQNFGGFDWNDIVPGDSTRDCIRVESTGSSDDALDVYVTHGPFGQDLDLRNATEWRYSVNGNVECSYATPHADKYTEDRGCFLGTVSPNSPLDFVVDVRFPDSGNQNGLQGLEFDFTATVTGYTG